MFVQHVVCFIVNFCFTVGILSFDVNLQGLIIFFESEKDSNNRKSFVTLYKLRDTSIWFKLGKDLFDIYLFKYEYECKNFIFSRKQLKRTNLSSVQIEMKRFASAFIQTLIIYITIVQVIKSKKLTGDSKKLVKFGSPLRPSKVLFKLKTTFIRKRIV